MEDHQLGRGQSKTMSMIETPCVSICRQENGSCIGCGRTMEEITQWMNYTDEQRRQIMERLENDNSFRFSD